MGATTEPDSTWTLPAEPSAVGQLRRRATAFATAAGATEDLAQAVALGVSEVVTNVVIHAYTGMEPGPVSVSCRVDGARLVVEVADDGAGIAARDDSPGAGQGLAIVGAMAQALDIAPRADGPGTVVTMSFAAAAPPLDALGLEPLCALALETVADVACVDAVSGGVLRRVAAEVRGDPALTAWLLGAAPPAKPGTATWTAMRGGGARLVVHDPAVPRSPGGPGEQLGLRWWLAVPLERPDGTPAALWGLGGRDGGRPVPPPGVIGALSDAARTDLTQDTQRAVLRTRLRRDGSGTDPADGHAPQADLGARRDGDA